MQTRQKKFKRKESQSICSMRMGPRIPRAQRVPFSLQCTFYSFTSSSSLSLHSTWLPEIRSKPTQNKILRVLEIQDAQPSGQVPGLPRSPHNNTYGEQRTLPARTMKHGVATRICSYTTCRSDVTDLAVLVIQVDLITAREPPSEGRPQTRLLRAEGRILLPAGRARLLYALRGPPSKHFEGRQT